MYDVAVIGAGMAGMATAARLQSRGLTTLVLEAHGQPGGCAGFYRRKGFSFDVGATTLVDFEAGGVGAELLEQIGLPPVEGEALPGYVAWLPDRRVTLYRDQAAWAAERLSTLGNSSAHREFWRLLDRLADVFWTASRRGIRLPVRTVADAIDAMRAIGVPNFPFARYSTWTVGGLLRRLGLRDDAALTGLLSMLIEDTVHGDVEDAPLVNAALGVTIRGAGLTRARGGMWGFWRTFLARYREMGGDLQLGCKVERVEGGKSGYVLHTSRGAFRAGQVVSAVPIQLSARIAPERCARPLKRYLARDADSMGGAIIVFLGVPEDQAAGQEFTHHQILQDYSGKMGNGNNMFVSVSAAGDSVSAPEGFRAVMISTHCELEPWEGLSDADYADQKREIGDRLVSYARRVYPRLGEDSLVMEVGTPRTYAHFTGRPRGAVGGVRQTLANSNQHAVPHDLVGHGFWLAGDTTWPGLGTVACVLGSRIVADAVTKAARSRRRQLGIKPIPGGEYVPGPIR